MKLGLLSLLSLAVSGEIALAQKKDTVVKSTQPVTVTALRHSEHIIEVPLAITVIGPERLDELRGYGLDEALRTVPGVLAQSRNGNHDVRITIRGFGARGAGDRSNAGTSRGIRFYVDGIPETEPDGRTAFDLIDLSMAQNIEILRSNASAIWGNASGGVVNISTRPLPGRAFAGTQINTGSFGLGKLLFRSNAPIGNGSIYFNLSETKFDGWREHSSSERLVANLGVQTTLGETTLLSISALGGKNFFEIPGPLNEQQYNENPLQANPVYLGRNERRFNRLGRLGMTVDHSFNEENGIAGILFVGTKYLQRSERGTFRDFNRYHTGGSLSYRNTMRFSDNIESKFLLGMDEQYQDGAVLFYTLSPDQNRGETLRNNQREGANNFGVFVQEEVLFSEKVSLTGALRYDNVTYYTEDFFDPEVAADKSFTRMTPKAGISYLFSPDHSIYANLGGGVEVPAGNETDAPPGEDTLTALNTRLEPIFSTTYEIGTKQNFSFGPGSLFRSFGYDAAVYMIDIQNDIVPYNAGQYYFTAGRTRRLGAEIGLNADLSPGFSLRAAGTWMQSEYREYLIDSVHYGRPGSFADRSGNKVAGIPDFFYNAALRYTPAFLDMIFVEAELNGVSEYFADDANRVTVPSYSLLNLTLGTERFPVMGDFFIRGNISVNNLLDAKYAASAFINPDYRNSVPVYLEPGLPRNFVLNLSLGWR